MACGASRPLRQSPGFLVGLAMVVVSQLCGLVHMGVVRHERCAEHGELVERSGPHALEGTDGATQTERVPVLAAALPGGDDTHDHCPLATLPGALAAPGPLLAASPPTTAEAVVIPAAPHAPRATQVLDVAPKTSPPARA